MYVPGNNGVALALQRNRNKKEIEVSFLLRIRVYHSTINNINTSSLESSRAAILARATARVDGRLNQI